MQSGLRLLQPNIDDHDRDLFVPSLRMREEATLRYLMRAGWPSANSKRMVVPTKHGRTNNETKRTGTNTLFA